MSSDPREPSTPFPFVWIAAMTLAVWALGLALAGGLLLAMGLHEQLAASAAASVVGLAAGLGALVPAWIGRRGSLSRLMMLVLAGSVVRMGVAVAGAAVLVLAAGFEPISTIFWVLGWYLMLLGVEVAALVRWLGDEKGRSE